MTDSRSERPGGHDVVVSPVGVPAAVPVGAAPDAVVSLSGVSVAYGSNVVLQGVDLAFGAGEITALLGANGAGKSTLIKALSGANARYGGEIRIGGEIMHLSSPVQARQLGISTVHQKVADGIVPGLSVAENLTLDDLAQASRHPLRRRRQALADARAALGTLGLDWSDAVLERDAATLPISDAQLLVLARALRSTPRLLILDEPTSALTAAEAERLFGVLRALRAQGLSIVYVSHRFGEIEALADRVVVLRDGLVQSVSSRPFAWHELLHDMLGRQTALDHDRGTAARGTDAVARLEGVVALPGSAPLDLEIRRGEVLGVLGLIGAGKTELAELLGGLAQPLAGSLSLEGAPYAPKRPSDAIRAGVVLVPEDRQKQGILPGWSVLRNITLPFLAESSALGLLRRRSERSRADTVIDTLSVVTAGPDALIDDLSGGNQQKVVVGRWLSAAPKLALLDEPFRGVDIAARREIGARVLVAGRIELDRYADTVDRPTIIHAFLGETASVTPADPAAARATSTDSAATAATAATPADAGAPTSSTPESRPERTSS